MWYHQLLLVLFVHLVHVFVMLTHSADVEDKATLKHMQSVTASIRL